MKNIKVFIAILCLFSILLLVINLPKFFSGVKTSLYINEIVADNKSIISDNGEFFDYIELYNNSNESINLEGFCLSDDIDDLKKWCFGEMEIKEKDYLLVFASGNDYCSNYCHTNFKLNNKETVILSDKDGNIVSKVDYPYLEKDTAYGYINNQYKVMNEATPGKENINVEFIRTSLTSSDIEISEYITHNTRVNYDTYGNYYDWVELHNISSSSITLENIYISDDENKLNKFKIPKTTMEKDEYLLLYFSGDEVDYDENIYIPFNIGDNDKYLIISNGENIILYVDVVKLKENMSYGKVNNEYKYFTNPTPGKENNTAYYELVIE